MADLTSRLDDAGRSSTEPTLRLGRLHSPTHESSLKNLLSNLKDFLTERPAKIRGGAGAFALPEFGASRKENLKEFFRAAPRGQVRSGLLVNWNRGFGGLWQNLRDMISPPKLPPFEGTSEPVDVPDIWTKDTQFTRVQALSVAFHVLVIVLLLLPFLPELLSPPTTKANSEVVGLDTSMFLPKLAPGAKKAGGGGGGGQHALLPASRGQLPKFSLTQMAPPLVSPIMHPKLGVTATVLGNPAIHLPSPNDPNYGDPLAKVLDDSGGTGSGSIGSGTGNGVGSGNGNGVGPGEGWNTGGGTPNMGENGYGTPVCLICPQAKFSDEAVKEKYQGTVTIVAIISPDGRASDIHVVKGLGLGLDENAIQAVRTWRFKPATGPDGRAAAVRATIEVQFVLH